MSERRVYIAQLLCPKRHAILGAAEEFDTAEAAEALSKQLEQFYSELVAAKVCRSSCAICQSRDFHIEIAVTGFRSMAEAKPVLLETERRNLAAQAFLKSHRN